MPRLLIVDEPQERVDEWRPELEEAGYLVVSLAGGTSDVTEPGAGPAGAHDETSARLGLLNTAPDAIVLGAPTATSRAWELLSSMRAVVELASVPVVMVVAPGALEDGLRAAIEGAVRCHAEPLAADTLVSTLDAVLAPDAPPVPEQRRRSRQRALEILARIEARGAAPDDETQPKLVHLTRLEHGPVRHTESGAFADARRRLAMLTTKQHALLELVREEGGVSAAASRLQTSRGNVYAGLRRIVHRLGMHDTRELLQLVGDGELSAPSRS